MDIKKAVATLHEALKEKKWYDGCCPSKAYAGEHKGKVIVVVYATKKPTEWEQVPKEWEMVAEHFPIVLEVDP